MAVCPPAPLQPPPPSLPTGFHRAIFLIYPRPAFACVCVCVCERDREQASERASERLRVGDRKGEKEGGGRREKGGGRRERGGPERATSHWHTHLETPLPATAPIAHRSAAQHHLFPHIRRRLPMSSSTFLPVHTHKRLTVTCLLFLAFCLSFTHPCLSLTHCASKARHMGL